jgi:hypothetical protein
VQESNRIRIRRREYGKLDVRMYTDGPDLEIRNPPKKQFTEEKRLEEGHKKLADAVKVTLGPKGRNVVLEKKFGCILSASRDLSSLWYYVRFRFKIIISSSHLNLQFCRASSRVIDARHACHHPL